MIQIILEYLRHNYFMVFYVITLFLALKKYPFYYNSVLKYFPIILGYTLLTELLGLLIRDYDGFQIVSSNEFPSANNLIFNIYDLVFFLYFYYVFWQTLIKTNHKNIIKYASLFYVASIIVNLFLDDVFIFPQIYASSIGSYILVGIIFLYFMENKQNLQKNNNLLVWISIGLFIFNLFFPIIMIWGRFDLELYKKLNLRQFHHLLIATMYICFMIGFLSTRHKIKLYEEI